MVRYAGAVVAVLAALGVRMALNPVLAMQVPYLPFALAVVVAARFGGRGPALVATLLSAGAAWFFLANRHGSLGMVELGGPGRLVLFAIVGCTVTLMVGQLRETLLESVRSEELFRNLFESMEEGFASCEMVYDGAGRPCDFRYLAVNRAFFRLTGLPVETVVGRRIREVLPDIEPFWIETYGRIVRTGVAERITSRVAALEKDYEVSAWRTGARQFAAVFRDETARQKAEDEIRTWNTTLERRVQERTAQLQDANRELEAFSYSVSHDLRAPLRSVEGFARILLRDYQGKLLDEKAADFLNRVSAASQHMGQLIADLLALSRISRLELSRREVNLSGIAAAALEELRNRDGDRKVDVRIQPGLMARADERLMRVALDNLLGNAWKFTGNTDAAVISFGTERVQPPGGGEPLAAGPDKGWAVAENGSRGTPAYFVRDNGAGFDMKNAAKLFAPFQRFHTEDEFEGTGIGLATVQRIIRRHGGRIWAESRPGRGATFYFTLGAE
jgi:signal transduction histidine kinase